MIQEGSRNVRVVQVVVVSVARVAVRNERVVRVVPGTGTNVGVPRPSALLLTTVFREWGLLHNSRDCGVIL